VQPGSSARRIHVTTAAEAAALDARTIAAGISSGELMRRAGTAAARILEDEYADRLAGGVYVATGPGNNGGDGWVLGGVLAGHGIPVRVAEALPARSGDAIHARSQAVDAVSVVREWSGEGVVVDALLGTGATGEPRGEIAAAVSVLARARESGARVVALDLPTGVDATAGAGEIVVRADLTIAFGTIKRGHLNSRSVCGRVVVADIGLVDAAEGERLPWLITPGEAYGLVPPIDVAAHKGSRGGVSILGGGAGMAGAAILSARGALRSGAGSARICVADENTVVAHTAAAAPLVTSWTRVLGNVQKYLGEWPEAIVCGPGLGTDGAAPELLERLLETWEGPLVLDADALNLLVGRMDELRTRLAARGRPARTVLTPHPAEMKRLLGDGSTTAEINARRYECAPALARLTGAVVLLKGVPTVIVAPDGRVRVNASGNAALATGGSGDVLAGIIGTLLAQDVDAFDAAAAGAWFHGRAAELATGDRTPRGIMIDDVVDRLRDVWNEPVNALPDGVLVELSAAR
jgi:ADP-dependent NAD(P)H-hydrate dehydratase / NAD(P)H-hydrate epimerase